MALKHPTHRVTVYCHALPGVIQIHHKRILHKRVGCRRNPARGEVHALPSKYGKSLGLSQRATKHKMSVEGRKKNENVRQDRMREKERTAVCARDDIVVSEVVLGDCQLHAGAPARNDALHARDEVDLRADPGFI